MTLLVAGGWCLAALGIGVNYANTFWEWVPIMMLGGGASALFLWQAGRVLASGRDPRQLPGPVAGANDKEKELLQALSERGELTPITAAVRTSLTADEAAEMLEELAGKGHLRLRVKDGVQSYAIGEQERLGVAGAPPEPAPPNSERTDARGELAEDPAAGADGPAGGLPAAGKTQPLEDPLSERELEVLALLASGRTGSEIARDLYIALGTVKTHTNNIYRKLGASKRSEALAKASEHGLIP